MWGNITLRLAGDWSEVGMKNLEPVRSPFCVMALCVVWGTHLNSGGLEGCPSLCFLLLQSFISSIRGSRGPLASLLGMCMLSCTSLRLPEHWGYLKAFGDPLRLSLPTFPCYIFVLSKCRLLHLKVLDLMDITAGMLAFPD